MKLACVVHRYGADFAGGSEGHCRAFAEKLAAAHDVTVLTTCARDHVTWRNVYAPGQSELSGVTIHRFPVIRERSMAEFSDLSRTVFAGTASENEEIEWFRANGPESPALIDHIASTGAQYDRVLFWTFRYYSSFFGLPPVSDRAILVPTAENDPALRLRVLGRFFSRPSGVIFLTPEEQELVEHCVQVPLPPSMVLGTGLDPAPLLPAADADDVLRKAGIREPYVLYLGRVDLNKGCEDLFRHFLDGGPSKDRDVQLVLAGPANMPIPSDRRIIPLGYVDDPVKERLLARAAVLVVPSFYESLCIALLEGWNHGVPALVNARCSVLEGQARRANGALYYRDTAEFNASLDYLLANADVRQRLGAQGRAYIDANYRWPVVLDRLETFLRSV